MVDHWPKPCPLCGAPVKMYSVPGQLLAKTFLCSQVKSHPLIQHTIYQGLSESSRAYLEKRYKEYAKYYHKQLEDGKYPTPRILIRAGVAKPNSQKKQTSYADGETFSRGGDTFNQVEPTDDTYSQIRREVEDNPFDDLRHENQ